MSCSLQLFQSVHFGGIYSSFEIVKRRKHGESILGQCFIVFWFSRAIVLAVEGVVNAGYRAIEQWALLLRNAWPKVSTICKIFKEQGVILTALLGLSAFFSMAETSITTLWPWKVAILLLTEITPKSIAVHNPTEVARFVVHLTERERQKLQVWSRIMPYRESFTWAIAMYPREPGLSLQKWAHTQVAVGAWVACYHDEIKVSLPAVWTPLHHLIFTFFHVDLQMKLEAPKPVVIGYAALPLSTHAQLRSEISLPIMRELVPQ
ncbi:hypothetical protein SLEP1_g54716 [Rubroshorea leprosula]|uniref:C2 DOCK-type domain-containing protein n=1 Tax=Rubroshorea leprosula TaxID=152421 RepID=A0AAV5MDA7_9ROSI|nr:hypothetical protein SLEP1_g54716 [Rubroshorea leprosula]